MTHAHQRLHFIGIGGAGMSAIAELLHRQGCHVTGSDLVAGETTHRLQQLGVSVHIGHDAAQLGDAQAVVVSSAVAADNPELRAAQARGLPVLPRAAMLAELMRGRVGIAVAGTHGKTTTTSLVAAVLIEAGVDPSFVIGGRYAATGAHARLGGGPHIVAEADESDASFLQLDPKLAVVTNIDADHMATYGHQLARLHDAFVDFVHRLPADGRAVLCTDDAGVQAVLPRLQRPTLSYGLGEAATLRGLQVQALPGGRMAFVARQRGAADLPLTLNLAGEHNVRNALAALAVARALDLPDVAVRQALAGFAGVGRRFERHGELRTADGGRCLLVDDYGHHPVELAAVLAAARGAWPGRRLVAAFQPHRYSRTRDCFDGFVDVLGRFDAVWLSAVYAAGEPPLAGADGAALAQALRRAGGTEVAYVDDIAALPGALLAGLRGGDVLITIGAGSIGGVPARLVELAGETR